jgi:WD40 repeat protein
MFGVAKQSDSFQKLWQGALTDYVTAIVWSPNGQFLVAASGAGEVSVLDVERRQLTLLQDVDGQSIDCLAFSFDGKFLATAGQRGQIKIWQFQSGLPQLTTTLETGLTWIDQLAWSPKTHDLAFQRGFDVQIWNAEKLEVVKILNLEATTQGLQWSPDGQTLAIAIKNSICVWRTQSWELQHFWETMAPSSALAWSLAGNYLAVGGIDRTVTIWEWGDENPWQIQGFPSKVSQLTWSDLPSTIGVPLLVASSSNGIVRWEKDRDHRIGWSSQVLERHHKKVQAIAFQPNSFLLASAADDGQICLWHLAKELSLTLKGATKGFACLAWHPQGHQLAAGGQDGEIFIWSKVLPKKGFG